jgi:hypothetical protein
VSVPVIKNPDQFLQNDSTLKKKFMLDDDTFSMEYQARGSKK